MKSKCFCRFLAFLLVFVMAVEFVPVYAVEELKSFLSAESDAAAVLTPTQEPSPQETAAPTTEPVVIREDISRREADTKHFLLSDGSYIAAKYKEPVHFKNDANVWQEIDNSLIYEQSSAATGLFDGFKTKANDFAVKFASDVRGNKLVQVS